jgi:MFS family permease
MTAPAAAASAVGGHLGSLAAVIATAAVFGLTYSLSAALIALDLAERGAGTSTVGLNAAMHALGVLAIALFLPRIVPRVGSRRTTLAALLLAAVVLALFPTVPGVWLWFPLRFVLGAASEALFVLSETWVNELCDERIRARSMATYVAALSVGFALGPLILSTVGTRGATPYLLGAGLALVAALLIASPKVAAPTYPEASPGNPLRLLWLAPVAISAEGLNAGIETAGLSFLPLYAIGQGWTEEGGTRLISCLMFGAILLQLPIGWLGDRMDRRRLAIVLGVVATAGALLWPLVLHDPWIAYPLLFVWGGVFAGIYTLMMAVVGSRFQGAELVGIYAVMGLVWGVGALLGPALAGLSMDLSPHGLPMFAALACLAFTVYATASRSAA